MKTVIRGNEATALAAKLCRPDVIPAYPITPSTLFPERISEYIADGELDSQFILVESEHSAMSACIGASATGARTCTCTASQGLALMHEMLFIASGMRLPIVMPIGNRALSAPINIWCDHQDTISERDSGWMQFYAEKNQEALDLVIIAFRIAEDKRVLLPAMVGLDAFVLTHTMEAVDVPDQNAVDEFLPSFVSPYSTLDPAKPMTIGSFGTPEYYMEFKYAQELAMHTAENVIDEIFEEFKNKFGREYQKLVGYKHEDAEILLLTMGSMSGTARATVDKLREEGKKVGLIKMTVLRPFPVKELIELTANCKALAVIERDISPGFGGAVFSEISATYINRDNRPKILNYIVGLGGRDITPPDFVTIVEKVENVLSTGIIENATEWINIRTEDIE
jgi:pyruvate ferredoxin oxidoreductase alpha subunit